jgi:exodeoxyribonuclease VII large subunit
MNDEKYLTVTKLNTKIKEAIEDNIGYIKVEGEVSSLRLSNGTVYCNLKDNDSSLSVIIWKSTYEKMKTKIKDGEKVKVEGCVDIYMRMGKYSIIVNKLICSGVGELREQYLKLQRKLEKKGYFDKDRKKKMPDNIKSIGIVTSSEGAAIKDILSVLQKNGYGANIFIYNCLVQGESCPVSVAKGIKYFNKEDNKVDIILVTRGGGSFEDLFGFSHRKVLDAIYESKIFTISAIGHEVDHTLSDSVADVRSATPSVAGALIAKTYKEQRLSSMKTEKFRYLRNKILDRLDETKEKIYSITLPTPFDKIKELKELLKTKMSYITEKLQKNINDKEIKVIQYKNIITAYNPQKINKLGYTLITTEENKTVRTKEEAKKLKYIKLVFPDGCVTAKIISNVN